MAARRSASSRSRSSRAAAPAVTVGKEIVLFSAPTPTGHIAVTQSIVQGYGPKPPRDNDVDSVNNDPDYDSDDVVLQGESTVLRRLRFFRRVGDDKTAAAKAGKAKDAGAGAGAGASASGTEADGDVTMGKDSDDGGEVFSDFVQTEMMVHIHLPPAALSSSTVSAILDRSVLVRSQLQLSYHRLFVACVSLTPFPGYFFAYHHHRRNNRMPPEDEELMHDRAVLMIGLGGGALPQFFLSLTRKRRMTVEVVEKDEGVIALAHKFFGVIESPKLRIHRQDGVEFVAEASVEAVVYDMVFIDVDDLTPDRSSVMAPPTTMCSIPFLTTVRRLLDEGGVAVFNVLHTAADGDDERFVADFVYNCCQVFVGVVVLLTVDGADNRVVACWNYELPDGEKINLGNGRFVETLCGPDLTHRLKRLVRNRPMLKQHMQRTRIGLLPLDEVLTRRTVSHPAPAASGAAPRK